MIEKIDKNEIYDLRSAVNLLTSKINEIIEHLNNQKQSLNSLYGITIQDYIKKEDLKEYLNIQSNDALRRIQIEDSETLKLFFSGYRFALYCIRSKFDLF